MSNSGVITDQVVQGKSRNDKCLKINDEWYGAFDASQSGTDVINPGDVVSFTFTIKEVPGGPTYRNIKGKVQLSSSGGGAYSGPPPSGSSASVPNTTPKKEAFPVGPRDYQRSIIRQNSLTNAVNLCNTWLRTEELDSTSTPDIAHVVVGVAEIFEAYSAGDKDVAEAQAAVEAVLSAPTPNNPLGVNTDH